MHGFNRWRPSLLAVRLFRRRLRREDAAWETHYGLDTSASSRDDSPSTGHANVPTPLRLSRWLFKSFADSLPDLVFVDYGSAKGRVAIVAAQAGIGSVIAVEYDADLIDRARANESKLSLPISIDWRHMDAGQFAPPQADAILYFNNPFGEEIMSQVLDQIEQSWRQSNHRYTIVYQQARFEDEPTSNIALITQRKFLTPRPAPHGSFLDRVLLYPYSVHWFETREQRPQESG